MKTKSITVHKGCSVDFFIATGDKKTSKQLLAEGNYATVSEDVRKILSTLRSEEPEEQIFDVELVEFTEKPEENEVQEAFKKQGLIFPNTFDALRFGAKYHEVGSLLNNVQRCSIMFPCELSKSDRRSKRFLAIDYSGGERNLVEGGFGTQWFERWYFAGLKLRKGCIKNLPGVPGFFLI